MRGKDKETVERWYEEEKQQRILNLLQSRANYILRGNKLDLTGQNHVQSASKKLGIT